MYLGIIAVIAKSFSRIHRSNLINFGILPLLFADESDYERVSQDDVLRIDGAREGIDSGSFTAVNETQRYDFELRCDFNEREKEVAKAGGRLNMIGR
jgi:aconitate hydratase